VDRRNDISVRAEAASQTGPCESNLLAAFDKCLEVDEIGVEFGAIFQEAAGDFFDQLTMTSSFQTAIGIINQAFNPSGDLLGAFFTDEGSLVRIRGTP